MKKIFSILLVVLFAGASILSGCGLITRNDYKYFNTVVIKVGEDEFTKEELILRFNQIGAQYVQQGETLEKSMEYTINSMVNRQLILNYTYELFGELSQPEKNDVWKEVYSSVNQQLKQIEEQIAKDWNLVLTGSEGDDEPTQHEVFKPYEPKVIYKNGQFVLVEEELRDEEEPIGAFVRENFNPGIDETASGKTYQEVQAESWDRYIRALKNNEKWKNLSTVNEEVFERELKRLYDIYEGNKYIEKFENNFNQTKGVQSDKVVQRYIELVMDSFSKYSTDMKAYHEAMASDDKSVYYHPNSGQEYIYVSHILIEFSEEQKAELEDLKEQKADGELDENQYNYLVQTIKNQTGTKPRDSEGFEYGQVMQVGDILTQIQNALAPLGSDVDAKAAMFNEFIYKYNSDPGILNQETPYVINLDTSVTDKMVKEFADTARHLYTLGEGSMSELVETSFGYHIIFYSKPVQNLIHYNNLSSITANALYDNILSAGLEKTMYHKVFDELNLRDYSNYQTALLNQLKSEVEVVLYKSRYQDLLK